MGEALNSSEYFSPYQFWPERKDQTHLVAEDRISKNQYDFFRFGPVLEPETTPKLPKN